MKHNIYFDGKVQSLGLTTEEGNATVGVISQGTFTFSTSSEEAHDHHLRGSQGETARPELETNGEKLRVGCSCKFVI